MSSLRTSYPIYALIASSYIWNTSPRADDYVKYAFGAFALELARALRKIQAGTAKRAQLFVGHDGECTRVAPCRVPSR